MTTILIILSLLALISVVLFAFTIKAINQAAAAVAQAEYEAKERQRVERMAKEMLKERSREDVARDLDSGGF